MKKIKDLLLATGMVTAYWLTPYNGALKLSVIGFSCVLAILLATQFKDLQNGNGVRSMFFVLIANALLAYTLGYPTTMVLVVVGGMALTCMSLSLETFSKDRVNTLPYRIEQLLGQIYTELSAAILVALVIEAFGTQIIWIPIVLLLVVNRMFTVYDGSNAAHLWSIPLGIIPLVVGLVSTLIEFWHSPILNGVSLASSFEYWGSAIVLYLVIPLIIKLNEEKQREKKRARMENERRMTEAYKRSIERERLSNGTASWDEIRRHYAIYHCDIDRVSDAWRSIIKIDLRQLVFISTEGKQVSWDNGLSLLLTLLEQTARNSHDAGTIETIVEKIKDLYGFAFIAFMNGYEGGRELRITIRKLCPTIMQLGVKENA